MKIAIKKSIILNLLSIVLFGALPFVAPAQDARLSDDITIDAGLSQLPAELRGRWISLKSLVDTVQYADYFQEGGLVIKQLGELILAVGGTAPTADQASYGVYADLQNRLLSVLDRIELALIFGMPDAELNRMLQRYRAEKDDLTLTNRREQQKLIEAGTKILRAHENDPYFLKYPHRRAVLADLYFRLTELMYGETYELFLEETDQYIAALDSLSKVDPKATQSLRRPQPDYSRVMAMYQRIVDEFPTSDFADDALYNLGVLTGTGESQAERNSANRLFETLVRIYPESSYKLNCLRRIGEYYFMPPINDLDRAVKIYTQITEEFSESEYYSEALYKLGWCYYRLSQIPDAVEFFARSLDAGYEVESGVRGTGLDIAKESINYIGVCFAVDPREWDGAGINNMTIWFQSNPERMKKYGKEVFRQLGVIYRTQIGRYSDAVEVYNKYCELFPLDPDAPIVLMEVVDIYQSGEVYNPQAAHNEKLRFFQSYSPDSEWWRVNTDKKVRDRITPTLERFLDMSIDETLVLATDSKDPTLFTEYENLSRQYLRYWPNGSHAYKIHFNLATVLESRPDREPSAIREYWQVATRYADSTQREISTQRVVALAQELAKRERSGEISMTSTGDIAPPELKKVELAPVDSAGTQAPASSIQTPLLNSERLLLSGFDLFIDRFPQSALTPTMLYQGGDILYRHDWFPDSRKYLEKLIADYPEHKFVEDAYKLILEGYFKVKDYAAVETVSGRIANNSHVSKDLKDASKRRKAESVFLTASNLKEGNDHKAAADQFKRVGLENPEYQYADRSLFQSGIEYMQANAFSEANEVFTILADRYPQSEYGDKALYNLGFNLQSQLKDPKRSAEAYERLVKAYPKSELSQGALANASQNYNQIGDDRSAIRVNQLYVQIFPQAEDASVYLFENASHYMKLEEVDKANEIYRQFAQRYPDDPRTVQAFFERGKYSLDKGDRTGASREFTSTLDAHQKLVGRGLSGSPRYASQSLNYLLQWEQEEYNKLRITGNDAAIKLAKQRKKDWRNALVEKYHQLIRFGQKEAYRSFYAIGKLDEDFALATYEQSVPQVKNLQGKIDTLARVVDEAIILNYVSAQSYKSGFENLRAISTPLKDEHARRQSDYDAFAGVVAQLQKDSTAVGLADSLSKLSALQRGLTELDSAVIEASNWADSCRYKMPYVAFLNGKYLAKLWYANFELRSTDKDEEVRMLFRQEVIKNIIAPMAPEICGLYLQAWNEAKSVGLGSKWRDAVELGYKETVDTLISKYVEQTNLAQARVDKNVKDFVNILPKGEDGKTPQGFYSDEMGGIILDQVDYLNNFTLDMLEGYRGILDTAAVYQIPYGFGESANDQLLQFVLKQSELFSKYSEDAQAKKIEFSAKYDETSELQYDDAQVAFEDIGNNFRDYTLILLESGLSLRQTYNLSGMAGIELTTKLVSLNPEKYGSQVGLSSDKTSVETNTEWLVWAQATEGFQNNDFDDSGWERALKAGFSTDVNMGILDSIGAEAIWYFREKPAPVIQEVAPQVEIPAQSEEPLVEDTSSSADSLVTTDSTLINEENPEVLAEEPPATPSTPVELVDTEADSLWRIWMNPDSNGVKTYWFRKSFTIYQPPSGGKFWLTADDNFSLYLNGAFVGEDSKDDNLDWMLVKEFPVLEFLKVGNNVVAIEASDMNNTRQGLRAGLIYEFVPDMNKQLASLSERELERDKSLKAQAVSKLRSDEEQINLGTNLPPEKQPEPQELTETVVEDNEMIAEPEKIVGPTPSQLRDMRIIEKNKLR